MTKRVYRKFYRTQNSVYSPVENNRMNLHKILENKYLGVSMASKNLQLVFLS